MNRLFHLLGFWYWLKSFFQQPKHNYKNCNKTKLGYYCKGSPGECR